jgi:hypothetical protein
VGICPSLYAVQMAQINGNYQTSHYALHSCQQLRNYVGIDAFHYSYKEKNGQMLYKLIIDTFEAIINTELL